MIDEDAAWIEMRDATLKRMQAHARNLVAEVLNDETLLTTQELADLTHISRQTFEGWRCRKNGGPPFMRLGVQLVRYRWRDVKAWMAERTVLPGKHST